MKIGCFSVVFGGKSLSEAADIIKGIGCEAIEIGTGNYPGNAHCDVEALLNDSSALNDFKSTIESSGLEISALSCHGNPLHPDNSIAKAHHKIHRMTVELAHKLEVPTVVNFSGCPGSGPDSKNPNWVTCTWPTDFENIVKWQWEEKVIPYWKEENDFADEHGINIGFEMHPGFVVYNTQTLLRLREECGERIGANFDPSHLFWQGMDPIACVRELGDCIWHVHAKDCSLDPSNVAVNGVLDYKPYGDEINRSWIFRSVGYGHPVHWWKQFVSELKLNGYDGALSIEHEDSLMSFDEGIKAAYSTLDQAIIRKKPGEIFWA